MSGRYYNRMAINVGSLIAEVHTRPVLWDKTSSGYTDRNCRDTAWNEVCLALYPDWYGYEESLQWVIEQDLRKRWKTVRDRFLKWHRQLPGSSSPPARKVPHHDELLFILPHRRLRPKLQQTESPDDEDVKPQLREPSPPPPAPEETVEIREIKQEEWPTTILMETHSPETPQHHMLFSPRSTPLCHVLPTPTRTSFPRRSQRTRRARDSLLEVESNELPHMRRGQGHDEWDAHGRGFAAACRQLRPEVRNDYVAFCLAAATDFTVGNPLRLGELISHMRQFTQTGPQEAPHPERPSLVSASTQTDPVGGWACCL